MRKDPHNLQKTIIQSMRGYTFLSREQSKMMINGRVLNEGGKIIQEINEESSDNENEIDAILEEDIRLISKIEENGNSLEDGFKKYFSAKNYSNRAKRFIKTESFGQMRILNPFLFANQVRDGAVLRRVALSPKAFSAQLLSPDFGSLSVLSPSAFVPSVLSPRAAIANILSPNAFTMELLTPQAFATDILSPRAFNAKVLSPRAFSAYVLSPRMLITEILSPKALEMRVLSPTFLSFVVLSPAFLQVSIASSQNYALQVLSPNILSPGFLNEGISNIRILSPRILSGRARR